MNTRVGFFKKKERTEDYRRNRKFIVEIILGLLLFAGAIVLSYYLNLTALAEFCVFALAYLVIGYTMIEHIIDYFKEKKFLDEYVLIVIATIGAFSIRRYEEGIIVLLCFQIGMMLQSLAVTRSRKSIAKMLDIRPSYANRKVNGQEVRVDPSELKKRNIIYIKPGEKVPVDCVVTVGTSSLDMKALTGESMPREVGVGDKLFSGSINLNGLLEARVAREYAESTASKIYNLVESAGNKKAETETYITKFAKIYTPIVILCAILVAVIPPAFVASELANWDRWLYRGLTFLVVAVPSALLISVPLAFLSGIGAASRHGILVKGSNFLEALHKTDTFIFDKTGTLTKGVFDVIEINPVNVTEEELLELVAIAENGSTHPIAQSLQKAYGREIDISRAKHMKELAGFGIRATLDGKKTFVGNAALMKQEGIAFKEVGTLGTAVYIAMDGEYAGYILISDSIREDAPYTIDTLHERYQAISVMLTGDVAPEAEAVAKELQMDYWYANLLPTDKVTRIEEFLEAQRGDERVAFVGDGMNDAPVLARADVGIAMGGLGSDAAIEAADVVLLDDEPSKIISAVRVATETIRVALQNTVVSMIIKIAVLGLAVVGLITMWEAVFVDFVVLILTIINSVWLIQYPE